MRSCGGQMSTGKQVRGHGAKFSRKMEDTVAALLTQPNVDAQSAPASTRVRAAEAIINHAAKAIEIEDIEARVSELERAAGTQKPGGRT
jgi:hypothetical protein